LNKSQNIFQAATRLLALPGLKVITVFQLIKKLPENELKKLKMPILLLKVVAVTRAGLTFIMEINPDYRSVLITFA